MSTPTPASNPSGSSPPMHESNLHGLERIHQGKVRDIYAIPGDDRHMLIVTTDRLSAFDVVLPDPIPGKGRVLTSISNFWFARTGHIVPNHLAAPAHANLAQVVPDAGDRARLADRAIVVRKLKALPVPGGYFQLVDYSAISDISDLEFCRWLTVEKGVTAIPLSPFYAEAPASQRVIRLCFAKTEATMAAAVERLVKV